MAITDRREGTATPSTPSDRKDGVTTGLAMKRPVRVVTVANITLAGLQTIDDVTLVADDRVLVTGQTTGVNNGIYVASSGNWTRAKDFDGSLDVVCGTLVFVTSGTLYQETFWRVSTADDITLGTTSLSFSQNTPLLTSFIQTGTGAVSRTYLAKAQEIYSVLDFIPVAEHAAIRAYTSTTDLATYLNAAIAAVASRKGILLWPAGLYPTASALGQTSMRNVVFQGEGGLDLTYAGTSGTVIKFTGTGAGSIITMTDHRGVWWRDIQVVYSSNSFTGTFFNCATTFQTGCASGFENVQCYQITNTGYTAGQCWYIKNNVDVTFRNCYASHANYGWVGLFTTDTAPPTNETNIIKLYSCTSIGLNTAAILNPVIGWSLYSHNFELGNSGATAGILTTSTFDIENLSLYSCVFADSTANGTWINIPNNVFGFTMIGGLIFAASGTVTGIRLGNTFCSGIKIDGVIFSVLTTGINFASSTTGASVTNCNFLTVTSPYANQSNCDDGSFFMANNPGTANRAIKVTYGGTGLAAGTSGGIPYYSSTTAITSSALLTTNAIVKGGGAGAAPVASGVLIDSSNNMSAPGNITAILGQAAQTQIAATNGNTSTSAIGALVASSNSGTLTVSANNNPNGAGQGGLSWTGSGGLLIAQANAAGSIVLATTASFTPRLTVASAGDVTISAGPLTLGASGTLGSVTFGNATSGTVKLQPVTGALGTVTLSLPAATDTLVGKATTDTLTNKTFNSAGTGNVLQVSGVTVSRGQFPGTSTNDAATAGNIGELIESVIAAGSAVSLTTATPANLTSISLTAGDWDVEINAAFLYGGTTNVVLDVMSISSTSATNDFTAGKFFLHNYGSSGVVPGGTNSNVVPSYRISLSGTTTIYAVAQCNFTVSTATVYGRLAARRVR